MDNKQHEITLEDVRKMTLEEFRQLSSEQKSKFTPEQREELAAAIYQLFSVEGAQTLTDMVAARKRWLAHSKQLDPKVHETIQKTLSMLIGLNAKSLFGGIVKKQKASKTE